MRRPMMLVLLGVSVALVAAGCGMTLQVTKETTGDAPGTGPFTVEITCEIPTGNPEDPTDTVTDTLNFTGPDFPLTLDSDEFELTPIGSTDCLVVETETGGATTTELACVDPPPEVTCTNTAEGLEVSGQGSIVLPEDVIVEVTVTNDFGTTTTTTAPPDPNALAIVAQPSFTG